MKSDIPNQCPGTSSKGAGVSSACEGCPNQKICSSGISKTPDPDTFVIKENLKRISIQVAIISGKGGVGKSTVTSQVALMLSTMYPDKIIGVIDADVCGPSQHRMLGVPNEVFFGSTAAGFSPIFTGPNENIAIASAGLFIEDNQALIWRGPKKIGLIKTLLKDVKWDQENIECLLIDTPPGTSDEHLSIITFLECLQGAVLVTGPQELSWQDVRKQIDFCAKSNVKILGVVLNMAGFECPKCGSFENIFPITESISSWARIHHIPFVSIPIDPLIAKRLDSGHPFVIEDNTRSEIIDAYKTICSWIINSKKNKL